MRRKLFVFLLFGLPVAHRLARGAHPHAGSNRRVTASAKKPLVLATSAEAGEPCPAEMSLVAGKYCTNVSERCIRWLDDSRLPFARCGVFAQPTRCVGPRVEMRFCIDRYEYTEPGNELPFNDASLEDAIRLCESLGKRVCTEAEWNFACEGEEMQPYPYGWKREPYCNQDRLNLLQRDSNGERLRDLREPANARPLCVSPFGVYNMVGNLDEPTLRELAAPASRFALALKGGWWMPARNRCRPATIAHDVNYRAFQVGVRCCSGAKPSNASQ